MCFVNVDAYVCVNIEDAGVFEMFSGRIMVFRDYLTSLMFWKLADVDFLN